MKRSKRSFSLKPLVNPFFLNDKELTHILRRKKLPVSKNRIKDSATLLNHYITSLKRREFNHSVKSIGKFLLTRDRPETLQDPLTIFVNKQRAKNPAQPLFSFTKYEVYAIKHQPSLSSWLEEWMACLPSNSLVSLREEEFAFYNLSQPRKDLNPQEGFNYPRKKEKVNKALVLRLWDGGHNSDNLFLHLIFEKCFFERFIFLTRGGLKGGHKVFEGKTNVYQANYNFKELNFGQIDAKFLDMIFKRTVQVLSLNSLMKPEKAHEKENSLLYLWKSTRMVKQLLGITNTPLCFYCKKEEYLCKTFNLHSQEFYPFFGEEVLDSYVNLIGMILQEREVM